jgi:Glyoxalase-like domain
MALEWEQVVVDAADPVALGRWWAAALEWVVVNDDPEEFEIRPAPDRRPGLLFARVPEPKTLKNRLHLDFRPDDRDAAAICRSSARRQVGPTNNSPLCRAEPSALSDEVGARVYRRPRWRDTTTA